MSDVVESAVKALQERFGREGFDGTVNFVIVDEGTVRIDEDGVSAGDGPADCTITASAETFESIFQGDLNPTSAFMTGKLAIEGDMGLAMRLAARLA